ncbi:MAG: hypothetical protein AAFU33_22325 [Bacteroidota bacterium]
MRSGLAGLGYALYLLEEGKPFKVAVMNKLIRQVFAFLQKSPYLTGNSYPSPPTSTIP